jgi:hypothetical protein
MTKLVPATIVTAAGPKTEVGVGVSSTAGAFVMALLSADVRGITGKLSPFGVD